MIIFGAGAVFRHAPVGRDELSVTAATNFHYEAGLKFLSYCDYVPNSI